MSSQIDMLHLLGWGADRGRTRRLVARRWLGDFRVRGPKRSGFRIPTLGLIASHPCRESFMHPEWEEALESALSLARRSGLQPFFASTTPYAARLRHACSRFGLHAIELSDRTDARSDILSGNVHLDFGNGDDSDGSGELRTTHRMDRAITALSHVLFVLQVRPRGNVARLVEARLREESIPAGTTLIAAHKTDHESLSHLLPLSEMGAVLWLTGPVAKRVRAPSSALSQTWGCKHRVLPATWMPCIQARSALLDSGEYLIHCTRKRLGAWPDQSLSHYYDEAILQQWSVTLRPIDSLLRILRTQRLIATQHLRRGGVSTVCFSQQPLSRLLALHSFQSHVGRWDWEPYGVAIRKEWLQTQGARPVNYLHRKQIERLPAEEQAFAQPLPQRPGDRDWRVEEEWRMVGDVRLSRLASDQAWIFVPSESDARLLSPWSRWPVVAVDRLIT